MRPIRKNEAEKDGLWCGQEGGKIRGRMVLWAVGERRHTCVDSLLGAPCLLAGCVPDAPLSQCPHVCESVRAVACVRASVCAVETQHRV